MAERNIQLRQAIREALQEEMRKDENVFMMGEEIGDYEGAYKVTQGMLKEFGPKRIMDTPISELGFTGIGVGASMNGLRPVIEFMTWNFAVLAMDQIINCAAKIYNMSGGQFNIPIVFRGPSGSAGQLGATHSQSFESWYANCPGLKVISTSDPYDAKGLLKSSIRDEDPVVFMESEVMYNSEGPVPEEEYTIPIGKARVRREGSDVTIVSFNKMIPEVLKAAEELEKQDVSAEVIDLRTIRPLDFETIIDSVKKTNRLVVVDESWPFGSISSEITFQVQKYAFDYLDAPIKRVNGADVPMSFAPTLVEAFLPNPERTIKASRSALYMD